LASSSKSARSLNQMAFESDHPTPYNKYMMHAQPSSDLCKRCITHYGTLSEARFMGAPRGSSVTQIMVMSQSSPTARVLDQVDCQCTCVSLSQYDIPTELCLTFSTIYDRRVVDMEITVLRCGEFRGMNLSVVNAAFNGRNVTTTEYWPSQTVYSLRRRIPTGHSYTSIQYG
jgi:hypothetical protein